MIQNRKSGEALILTFLNDDYTKSIKMFPGNHASIRQNLLSMISINFNGDDVAKSKF